MKKWSTIYSNKIKERGGAEEYLNYKVKEKEIFINKIISYCKPYKNILEAGCGTGVLSIYLANKGFDVTAVDNDQKMLNIANKICMKYHKKPHFITAFKNTPQFIAEMN